MKILIAIFLCQILFSCAQIIESNSNSYSNGVQCGLSKTTELQHYNCKNNRITLTQSMDQTNTRIVNGIDASIGEFPWVSSIFVKSGTYCGAVIIHTNWILSAAHCFQK